jgi:hypothetical protein
MARSDDEKKRRIEFLTATLEQKEKYEQAFQESGLKKSPFIRMALDSFIEGEVKDSPAEKYKDKQIADLESENERLRAALSLKTRANEQLGGELRRVRIRLTGDLSEFDGGDLAFQIERLMEEAGTITRAQLLSQIEDAHQIPHLVKALNEIEGALQRSGRIVILQGGDIQWLG